MHRLQRLRLVYTFWALKTKPQDLTESQNNSSNVGRWGSGNPSSSKRCTSSSQATARFGQGHWTRDAPETVPQCVSLPLMPSAWDSPIQLAGPFHCSMIQPCSYHVLNYIIYHVPTLPCEKSVCFFLIEVCVFILSLQVTSSAFTSRRSKGMTIKPIGPIARAKVAVNIGWYFKEPQIKSPSSSYNRFMNPSNRQDADMGHFIK